VPIGGAVPAPAVEDMRGLAARAAADGLRRMGATLDRPRFEDLVSDLTIVGLVAKQKFDPEFGQAESTFIYRRMRVRIADWYRK
jgi:hypothetical protein